MELQIATAASRKEAVWKNRRVTWDWLISKLATTHRTHETLKQYDAFKKEQQDNIKDIGGFVGGYLTRGRRNKGSVAARQIVTLDIDFSTGDAWENFKIQTDCAAVVYSTHKHRPEAPRLRIVLPLDREVMSDEYEPIARRIASWIGIESFDPTTYQPERLMYWPSTSADGEFFFEEQKGPALSANDVLSTYRDWTDTSEWPVSTRESEIIRNSLVKAGNPLEKEGVVGAFCRTYTVTEAIEKFLSDKYTPCDVANRYTYIEGSTSAGLVVYDDVFTFSHHSTDPTSGKLCNAFDLVRLHKFGHMDDKAHEDTPIHKRASYEAMCQLATKDQATVKTLGEERMSKVAQDFGDFDDVEPESTEWLKDMDVDKKGNYLSTAHNILLILENDPNLKGKLALNLFDNREEALGDLPWRKVDPRNRALKNEDDAGLRVYLERVYQITGKDRISDCVTMIMRKNAYHPIKNTLEKVVWDNNLRLDNLLIDYFGAADTPYTRVVMRKTLLAAIARIYQPGIKFDNVLVLSGKEGIMKSTFIQRLSLGWFTDSIKSLQGKDAMEQMQGTWIVELAELASLKKAEVETVKTFVASQVDRFRVAYGRRTENFPRQCIFIGTTNRFDFLKAADGNRRFWPVIVGVGKARKHVVDDLTEQEVLQILAEAKYYYDAGETLYLDKEDEALARQMQDRHTEKDARSGLIEQYLEMLLPEDWSERDSYTRRSYFKEHCSKVETFTVPGTIKRTQVCAVEIYCEALGGEQSNLSSYIIRDIHNIIRSLGGWEEGGRKRVDRYGTQNIYVKK